METKKHDFTKILDYELLIKSRFKNPLSPLLYFKVLKTKELMRRMNYGFGIKSFRKLLIKYEKLGLIKRKRESSNSCWYIYPAEKLLRERYEEKWREYFVYDEEIDTIRFHWQTAKIYRFLSEDSTEQNSYINCSPQPHYDFKFDHYVDRRLIFGLYTCLYEYEEKDEETFFKDLNIRYREGGISHPIILTRNWNEKAQKIFIEIFFKTEYFKDQIAWCHIEESHETKEDFFNAKLMTLNRQMTLREYIQGGAEKILEEIENPPKEEEEEKGLFQSIKEFFTDEKKEE